MTKTIRTKYQGYSVTITNDISGDRSLDYCDCKGFFRWGRCYHVELRRKENDLPYDNKQLVRKFKRG